MSSKKVGILKARQKVLSISNAKKWKNQINNSNKVTTEDEIRQIKSRIKSLEYDLSIHFVGNEIMQRKLNDYKNQLNKLEELKGGEENDKNKCSISNA